MSQPTTDNLTKDQQAQILQKISSLRPQPTRVADFSQDVKQSVLFRPGFNWNELLSAAPVSVSLVSSLFVASNINDAKQIKVFPPDGGFKYLQFVHHLLTRLRL